MEKEKNIVNYSWEEIKQRLDGRGISPKFHTMTDAEIEANAASDADDPTNDPDFWEKSERIYPKDVLSKIEVGIDREIYDFMREHHWNIQTSVNAALREYMRNHRQ